MWIWLDKTGRVKQYLTHGPSPVVGETDFQIFAYFDGLDTEFFDSATIKFRKPDVNGSSYPILFMKKVDMEYKKMDSDGDSSNFSENHGPYTGFLFDFSDFTRDDEIVRLLDTPGLWSATITCLGTPNKANVSGLITFSVGQSAFDGESETELTIDQIFENFVLHQGIVGKTSTIYLKKASDFVKDANEGNLLMGVFSVGSIAFDENSKNFYKILTVTANPIDDTRVYATYSKAFEYLKIKNISGETALSEIREPDGDRAVLACREQKYYFCHVWESSAKNFVFFKIIDLTTGKRYAGYVPSSTTFDISVSDSYHEKWDEMKEETADRKEADNAKISPAIETVLPNFKTAQLGEGAHPRILKYGDESYFLFADDKYATSTDGENWKGYAQLTTKDKELASHGIELTEIANAFPFKLKSGIICVLFQANNPNTNYFSIRLILSDVNVTSWNKESIILIENDTGLREPFAMPSDDASLVGFHMWYSSEKSRNGRQDIRGCRVFVRPDSSAEVAGDGVCLDSQSYEYEMTRIGMPSVAKLSDGNYAMIVENSYMEKSDPSHPMAVQVSYNASIAETDAGNWTKPQTIFLDLLEEGKEMGAPRIAALEDGRIIVSFQSDCIYRGYEKEPRQYNCQWFAFVSRMPVKYGDALASSDFIQLHSYGYKENDYGIWGSVAVTDNSIFKAFCLGKNGEAKPSERIIVEKCDFFDVKKLAMKNDRELTITLDYAPNLDILSMNMKAYVSEETYEKITNLYYETIKIKYNEGTPACVFHPVYFYQSAGNGIKRYLAPFAAGMPLPSDEWYGSSLNYPIYAILSNGSDSSGKYVYMQASSPSGFNILSLKKSNFDNLYKTEPLTDGDIDAILI